MTVAATAPTLLGWVTVGITLVLVLGFTILALTIPGDSND